jgi:regulatory protein
VSGSLEQTFASAYSFLNRRERTTEEMRAYLAKRTDSDTETIETVLAELTERDFLNDERYARCFAEDRRNLDSWGSQRIYRRLLELGVEPETAQQASRAEDDEQELTVALALLRRRVKVLEPDPAARQRALGVLARRGYPSSVAYKAVRMLEQETLARRESLEAS